MSAKFNPSVSRALQVQAANESFLVQAIKIVGKEVVLAIINKLFNKKKKNEITAEAPIPPLSATQVIKLNSVLVTMLLAIGTEQLVSTLSEVLKKAPKENLEPVLKSINTLVLGIAKSKKIKL